MGLLEQIPIIGPFASYLLPFLLVLTIVVFVHEYGHYIVARWCGVHSDAFSIGFGPELWGRVDSRGTRWKVSLIPLGGYVKFRGDADAASARTDEDALAQMTPTERAGSFPAASLRSRTAIVAAGPVFNFVLAALLFAATAMFAGVPSDRPVIGTVVEETEGARAGFQTGDRLLSVDGTPVDSFTTFADLVLEEHGKIYDVAIERGGDALILPFEYKPPVVLSSVTQGSAADDAGLRPRDRIVTVDGRPIASFEELREIVGASDGKALALGVEREGDVFVTQLSPRRTELREPSGEIVERWLIGVRSDPAFGLGSELAPLNPVSAIGHGIETTGNVLGGTLFFLYELIAGRGDTGDLGGPVRIAEFSGQAAEEGLTALIRLTAILSASIGLINLFPIPVLDGGHLLFYGIEAVRGKPLNERVQEIGLTIGFALVVMLMLYATYNDVARL